MEQSQGTSSMFFLMNSLPQDDELLNKIRQLKPCNRTSSYGGKKEEKLGWAYSQKTV